MWFEKLSGFREQSPQQVRENMSVNEEILQSHINGKKMVHGALETPSLAELRQRIHSKKPPPGKITLREVIGDVQELHLNKSNAGVLFQVASQFNLLEMISPDVTPEHGVDDYEYDLTQGPACAVAAGAGTIYRNYFAKVNGKIGQSVANQIDCLADIGNALGNTNNRLWEMKNGYALASEFGLIEITKRLESSTESEIDELRQLLRIGIQWNTEVTLSISRHTVSQAYCSALPVGYSELPSKLWDPFARLVLEASYEAAMCAGILNSLSNGNNKIYLTLIGGGAFGNEDDWIISAVKRALNCYRQDFDLDVGIVSYDSSKESVQKLVHRLSPQR